MSERIFQALPPALPASHAKPRHVLNIPSFDFAQFSLSSPLQHHCSRKFSDGITLPFFAILPVLRIMTSNQHANCHTSGAAPKRQCPRLTNRPKMAAATPQEPPQNGGRRTSGAAPKWRPPHLNGGSKMAAVVPLSQAQQSVRKHAANTAAICSGDSFSSLMYAFFLHLEKKEKLNSFNGVSSGLYCLEFGSFHQ